MTNLPSRWGNSGRDGTVYGEYTLFVIERGGPQSGQYYYRCPRTGTHADNEDDFIRLLAQDIADLKERTAREEKDWA